MIKSMKKLIVIFAAVTMCFVLSSCANTAADELIEEYEEEIDELKEKIKAQKKELEEKEKALAERDQTNRDYEEKLNGSGQVTDPENKENGNTSEKPSGTVEAQPVSVQDHPLLQFFYGEWEYQQHRQSDMPFVKLVAEKDGTCVADGMAGTWTVADNSTEECMRVNVSVDGQVIGIAQVEINDEGQWAFEAYPPNQIFSLYTDWKNNVPIVADENDIALTTENWREYFEIFTDDEVYNENDFGEVTHMQLHQYIVLKPEYADKVLAQDVVYELKINANYHEIIVDEEERTYAIGEVKFPREISYMGTLGRRGFFNGTSNYSLCMVNPNQIGVSKELRERFGTAGAWITDMDCVEMVRMKGALYFKNE